MKTKRPFLKKTAGSLPPELDIVNTFIHGGDGKEFTKDFRASLSPCDMGTLYKLSTALNLLNVAGESLADEEKANPLPESTYRHVDWAFFVLACMANAVEQLITESEGKK